MSRTRDIPWRDHLTEVERRIVAEAERLRDGWRTAKSRRADIISKASARARAAKAAEKGGRS